MFATAGATSGSCNHSAGHVSKLTLSIAATTSLRPSKHINFGPEAGRGRAAPRRFETVGTAIDAEAGAILYLVARDTLRQRLARKHDMGRFPHTGQSHESHLTEALLVLCVVPCADSWSCQSLLLQEVA
ncbi:hypothetical protein DOTSEDRAFT_75858 [Dothistroma septosporum NZE10]|uniref:Uncharacterized protein n=1 Tax=Dothistroma septosporum (strain NZE10 / CBS 128990) TaxID=675120 RepID=N1PE66_DOTSN|nr:hypothetical protein DOTSEDRAFT_75858 [Dothistroma septosporum NZE10]